MTEKTSISFAKSNIKLIGIPINHSWLTVPVAVATHHHIQVTTKCNIKLTHKHIPEAAEAWVLNEKLSVYLTIQSGKTNKR